MTEPKAAEVVHIAGLDVKVGSCVRQLCAWCGEVLEDFDLSTVMVAGGHEPPTWKVGELVAKDGGAMWLVEHNDGDQLPPTACVPPSDLSSLEASRD